MRGTMLWFNEDKDHGFISTDEGERLLVNGSDFEGGVRLHGPCAGLEVEFLVANDVTGRHATGVKLVQQINPRRARRRSRA
jgi:cold shock CspA family protein